MEFAFWVCLNTFTNEVRHLLWNNLTFSWLLKVPGNIIQSTPHGELNITLFGISQFAQHYSHKWYLCRKGFCELWLICWRYLDAQWEGDNLSAEGVKMDKMLPASRFTCLRLRIKPSYPGRCSHNNCPNIFINV